MSNVDGDILLRLVEYCYTGCVVISEETVVELFKTANKLLLRNVVTACENFLEEHIDPSNCFGLVLLAERYHFERLLRLAKDYCLHHLLKIYGTNEFLDLTVEQLSQLLASDDLCVPTEENVFNSLMRWVDHDRNERVKHLAELLKFVRMPLLERSFLIEHVKPICTTIDCLQIYTEALEWHLSPDSSRSKSTNLRKSDEVLLAISLGKSQNKIFIHYYCPQRNEWMKWLKDLEYHCGFGTAVMDNYLIIVGGRDTADNVLNTVIRVNLKTMTLEQMTSLNEHRAHFCAVALNGTLYVVGGINNGRALSSVEKWNAETNKWDVVASMLTGRYDFGIAVLNGKLYAVGGSNGNELNSVECYDPIQDVWQIIESMNESHVTSHVRVANGMLYAVNCFGDNKTVEQYDPQTNQWTSMCSISKQLIASQLCTSLRNKVVILHKNRLEKFDLATNEWKEIMDCRQLDNIYVIYSYSNKLLTSEFVKN